MIIYKGTNTVNGKTYIGQTIKTLEHRIAQHRRSVSYNHTKDYPLYRAIRKHGWDAFEWEVIDTANSQSELDSKEIQWIAYYDSIIGHNGYNVKLGGLGGKQLPQTRLKISKSQRGSLNHRYGKPSPTRQTVICVEDGKEFLSATQCAEYYGLSVSKVCAVCRGERHTTGGKHFKYEHKQAKPSKPRLRYRVLCIELNKEFNSLKEASEFCGLSPCNLGTLLRQGDSTKTFGGYHWKKLGEELY